MNKEIGPIDDKEVLVLGDSHAGVFSSPYASIPGYIFNVISVGGATISGLRNPNSVTQALPLFEEAINRYEGTICITLLGEVDLGFVIWLHASKYQKCIMDLVATTVDKYVEFIEGISPDKTVIVISTPLPTIRDGLHWGGVGNARRDVTSTQIERTAITMEFNRRMRACTERNGLFFLDLDSISLGEDGTVQPRLLNPDPLNHHYSSEAYGEIIKPKLKEVLDKIVYGLAPSRFR